MKPNEVANYRILNNSNGSTVYRTTVTGLSRDQATGLCNAIKAAGGDCFVR